MNYIVPKITKYSNIDELLKNKSKTPSLFDIENFLSIDDLLNENFVCIVGEPGIGKSRLISEIKKNHTKKLLFTCNASDFKSQEIPSGIEYCIVDALDEVDGSDFSNTLQLIRQYKEKHQNVKVILSCRKHYVVSYASLFASCTKLVFVELNRLEDQEVKKIIDKCTDITKENINKSPKLRKLLSIPRYLTFLLKSENQRGAISNIGDLFEFIIDNSIEEALMVDNAIKKENLKVIIKRVLEKIAFIMEISRKDKISKDDLYTIIDELKGNMAHMLVANFDLLFFESRILKETNGILQFENSEIQEYLAAKELGRQDNIESVLYDVAVQKELKHIYPNWYDVIPHLSYSEGRSDSFVNVFKLITSYESHLENETFESLLRYVNPSTLGVQQRKELFSNLFEHYQRVPAYIKWRGPIQNLIQECYTSSCNTILKISSDQLNKIQLTNIYATLEGLVENNKLDESVIKHWEDAARALMGTKDSEMQQIALNFYYALKDDEELRELASTFNSFTEDVKQKYIEVTGYRRITDKLVIDCWLTYCDKSNPEAINAVLYIDDPESIIYAYNKILSKGIRDFFNPKGSLLVLYDFYLKKQFDVVWKFNQDRRKLMTKVIAYFVKNRNYSSLKEINTVVKQILLEEETGMIFFNCFEKDIWELEDLFRTFDADLIDADLISKLDTLLKDIKVEEWEVDYILTVLVNKIRKDESKKNTISEYIKRYEKTFELWDQNSRKMVQEREPNPSLIQAYQSLSSPELSKYNKFEIAYKLSKKIDFLSKQEHKPIVDVITDFFNEIDLDKLILKKNGENSHRLSLVKIPSYVRVLHHLGYRELLEKYKDTLIKTLPIVCCTMNFDSHEIKDIYKSVIGNINQDEKSAIVRWWEDRKDDFMNVSSDDIFACITDYGFDTLSYKLEEYIEKYIEDKSLGNKIAASRALDLISEDYCKWDINKYKDLFKRLEDESIESIKMQCNAIMIEKFQESEAINWRIEYLRANVTKSVHNETGHARCISREESEMISPNPYMFRCFMNIKNNDDLIKQMLDLFEFGLPLCLKPETQEYSSYLLRQIYLFFVNINNITYISELRKKVEAFNAKNMSYLAYLIMNNAENIFLKNETITISKAIKLYNRCIDEFYLQIRNNGDLRRYFSKIQYEVQKEIQDQGIYALVRQQSLSEDYIQRELKNTIINKCCQIGLETIQVDREVTLQDNKRTDLLIRYGLCDPIMIELKLLHNSEIKNMKKRQEYKKKFVQYTNATNACLSVFWVFDVHKGGSIEDFDNLKTEYRNLDNTLVLLTDCRCSSGIETGIPQVKNNIGSKKARGNKTRSKNK
ncbi:NACHT domain-containing protein [Prevotella jejuni]